MPDSLTEILPLLAPLIILELGLIALALWDLTKREHVRFDNKLLWGAVVVLLGFVGPLAYFLAGRDDE